MGGIGAGSFEINQSGTFGGWNFGGQRNGNRLENRIVPQAAFHVREKIGDGEATVTTLATKGPQNTGPKGPVPSRSWGDPLPAWNLLGEGDADYAALYPFGWITYDTLQTEVAMRFYSPIVAGEDRRSSLPVAYFDVKIANTTDEIADVSTMFTMPNAPGTTGAPASIREGLTSAAVVDDATGITAITMGTDSASNTPDATGSEWTIAAKVNDSQSVSYLTSWNGSGDGSDVYDEFSAAGTLSDQALDSSNSAGAIAVSARLAPGETTTVPFVLTWDFPQVTFNNDQSVWMRRYTEFYGAQITDASNAAAGDYNRYVPGSYPLHQSRNIATDALTQADANLAAVEAWWKPYATDERYPRILRTAALNQLAQVASKTWLWAAGLVASAEPTLGQRLGSTHPGIRPYYAPDASLGANETMGTDVTSYSYLAFNRFFPQIERDRLRAMAEGIIADPNGNPDDIKIKDPYIGWEQLPSPAPETNNFIDIPAKRIYRMLAYAKLNRDPGFLAEVYPAMKRQLQFLHGTIAAGEHLPRGAQAPTVSVLPMPNSFNVVPISGRDAYTSMLYILSLEAVADAATELGEDDASVQSWRGEATQARAEFETVFWDDTHNWYRYTEYDNGSAALLDTFHAQHVAEQLGLPDLVNPERYRTQLASTYHQFMVRDAGDTLIGAYNLLLPDGKTTYPLIYDLFGQKQIIQEVQIWTGVNYTVGATYLNAGAKFNDPSLAAHGIEMAASVASQIWEKDQNGLAFNSPEAWDKSSTEVYLYPGYERPLAIWDTMNAIRPLWDSGDPQQQEPTLLGELPPLRVGDPVQYQFDVTGQPAPTVEVTQGVLPPGLTLSPTGLLEGTPTEAGQYPFTFAARNGAGPDATLALTATVEQRPHDARLHVDRATIRPGEQQTVHGEGFTPGAQVVLTLRSDPVDIGTVVATADGRFDYTFTVPNIAAGTHTLTATDPTDGDVTITFEVLAAAADTPAPTAPNDPDGALARTGFDGTVMTWIAVASIALILLGATFLLRRRRKATE